MAPLPDIVEITAGAHLPAEHYGARSGTLGRLLKAELPVPQGFAISVDAVRRLATGAPADLSLLDGIFTSGRLWSVRRAPQERSWGGPRAVLNLGMTDAACATLAKHMGEEAAFDQYCRFIRAYALKVARLDEDDLEELVEAEYTNRNRSHAELARALLNFCEDALDEPFPQDPMVQLRNALRATARMWAGTTARLLREARGAPADAGLALIVQDMALGMGKGETGVGLAQFSSVVTGLPGAHGRYQRDGQKDAASGRGGEHYLGRDRRGPSLEETAPLVFRTLQELAARARVCERDEVALQFSVQDGVLWVLDAMLAERSGRAAVEIVVRLVKDGILDRAEALMRVAPGTLTEMLHRQVDPKAPLEVLTTAIAAAPGAASGRLVFSAAAAQAAAAQEEDCILVRHETSPEDIRGMHSAKGILTERGGITSHAAVIARGLGLPCIVGAADIHLDERRRIITLPDGTRLKEGDEITLDGTTGEVIAGCQALSEPDLSGSFNVFLDWTDEFRTMGVRANVDTPADARLARTFGIDGIGLCRTEHMFFEPGRLTAMREMILAEDERERAAALDRLLPMQRADFEELFSIMAGQPVCIRLLDPPLHEFLPQTTAERHALAEAMDLPLARVLARAEDMAEYNPMLGMRGVRLGLTVPGIYDMQTRAIFEAASAVQERSGTRVSPEIMIPLVSANREVQIVKSRIERVSAEVRTSTGQHLDYRVGVMVETPRAALKAGFIAHHSEFLSFGTNDLTQMTYGLSRDDAGKFMRDYVKAGVYSEDPFHSIDRAAVGELLRLAVERAQAVKPAIDLGLCGEHGGDPDSVALCQELGLHYVSCSPYRTPVARLAAAQAALARAGQSAI
ncbi:MAG: pyruvate, phosphate dikinase [Rhodobacteraceae bacterium]|nr:pyruvate, phosphate dikinase [Paracoccaceae bacterium]